MYLIDAFVSCELFYFLTVWSNTSKENIRKLQLVQNYACRIVTGLEKYDQISEALKSLNWLNLKRKLLFNDLVMVYKCMNNLTPEYLYERFQHHSEIHQRHQAKEQPLVAQMQNPMGFCLPWGKTIELFTKGDQKHKKALTSL